MELYLYTSPESDDQPIEMRTASALPIVLWDRVSPDEAHAQTENALKLARVLGIADLEDGPLVAAAALALYGIAFMGQYSSSLDIRRSQFRTQANAGKSGIDGDQGGHIIGHRFMDDQGTKNLFPQNANLNKSAFKTMEKRMGGLD